MRDRRGNRSSTNETIDRTPSAVGHPSPTQRHAGRTGAVQRAILDGAWASRPIQLTTDAQTGLDDDAVRAAAGHGLSGPGQSLPHLDAIQRSFGDHDVSGVQAHFGAQAQDANAALGSHAYATGNAVAFATDSPSVHLVAHEAAHVVQQRAGVHLSSAVGQAGDSYEQHADAVADRVVRGESAADLLGAVTGGSAVAREVQRDANQPAKPADKAAAPAAKAAVPEDVDVIIDRWEDLNEEATRAHRDWAIANWALFLSRTAPQAYTSMNASTYDTFISGVWGNMWTDAPDLMFELAGHGIADTAKETATKAVLGEAVEAAAVSFGAAAGGAVGLLVSSALATMAEMAFDALVKSPDEANPKIAKGATLSVQQTTDILTSLIGTCDSVIIKVTDDARELRRVAQRLREPAEISNFTEGLWAGIAEVGASLTATSDRSLYRELMRDWVLANAVSPTAPKDSTVQAENWQEAAGDEEIMGEGGLAGQTAKYDARASSQTRRTVGQIDGWDVNNLQEHQARIALRGAGLSYERVQAELSVPRPVRGAKYTLEVVDWDRYVAFVVRNWGADPEDLEPRARVTIDCERRHERRSGPSSDYLVDVVSEIRIEPALHSGGGPEPRASRPDERFLPSKSFHPAE